MSVYCCSPVSSAGLLPRLTLPGLVCLAWDNSYAKWRGKSVRVAVQVTPPGVDVVLPPPLQLQEPALPGEGSVLELTAPSSSHVSVTGPWRENSKFDTLMTTLNHCIAGRGFNLKL